MAYRCQGVSAKLLPPTYEAYKEHFTEQCRTRLRRTPAVEQLLGQLEGGTIDRPPQVPPLVWSKLAQCALSKYIRILTVGGLPPEVRENLDIPWGKTDQLTLRGLDWVVKNVVNPLSPQYLSYHPSLVRSLLPPTKLYQRLLCSMGEFVADLSFREKEPRSSANSRA